MNDRLGIDDLKQRDGESKDEFVRRAQNLVQQYWDRTPEEKDDDTFRQALNMGYDPESRDRTIPLFRLNERIRMRSTLHLGSCPRLPSPYSHAPRKDRVRVLLRITRRHVERVAEECCPAEDQRKAVQPILDALDEWIATNEQYGSSPRGVPWPRVADWLDELEDLSRRIGLSKPIMRGYLPRPTKDELPGTPKRDRSRATAQPSEQWKDPRPVTFARKYPNITMPGVEPSTGVFNYTGSELLFDSRATEKNRKTITYVVPEKGYDDGPEYDMLPDFRTLEKIRRYIFYSFPTDDPAGYRKYVPAGYRDVDEGALIRAILDKRAGRPTTLKLVGPITYKSLDYTYGRRIDELQNVITTTTGDTVRSHDDDYFHQLLRDGVIHEGELDALELYDWAGINDDGRLVPVYEHAAARRKQKDEHNRKVNAARRQAQDEARRMYREALREERQRLAKLGLPRRNRHNPDQKLREQYMTDSYYDTKRRRRKAAPKPPRVGEATGTPKSEADTRNKPPRSPATGTQYLPDTTIEVPKDNPWFTD